MVVRKVSLISVGVQMVVGERESCDSAIKGEDVWKVRRRRMRVRGRGRGGMILGRGVGKRVGKVVGGYLLPLVGLYFLGYIWKFKFFLPLSYTITQDRD